MRSGVDLKKYWEECEKKQMCNRLFLMSYGWIPESDDLFSQWYYKDDLINTAWALNYLCSELLFKAGWKRVLVYFETRIGKARQYTLRDYKLNPVSRKAYRGDEAEDLIITRLPEEEFYSNYCCGMTHQVNALLWEKFLEENFDPKEEFYLRMDIYSAHYRLESRAVAEAANASYESLLPEAFKSKA